MNVLFVDFDGVLHGYHDFYDNNFNRVDKETQKELLRKRIKILGDICKENNCKVVFETSYKSEIDEDTLTSEVDWIQEILDIAKENGIDVIGRTRELRDIRDDYEDLPPIWKDYEILDYIERHPEIDKYCVLDDDDRKAMHQKSDLDMVRDHLLETIYIGKNSNEEGLLEEHKEEVKKILEKPIDKEMVRRLEWKKKNPVE